MNKTVDTYCLNVLAGKIPAGQHLKNAVLRYQKDLESDRFDFKPQSARKVVKFIKELKHFMGVHDKKPFKLQPWQLFIVSNIYGFFNKDGTRRFNTAYIEVARKNGKTAFVAALELYHLIADNEAGAEVLHAANSLDQAKIGFNMVSGFARTFDPDGTFLKMRHRDVLIKNTSSFIRVLASDASKLDGYNSSMATVDEYHSAPTTYVRDVLRSSMGMREQPMLITITTAGFDKNLPCYDLRTVAAEIAAGAKTDDTFFSLIFALDEEDDWKNEKLWIKSNPNLDVTVKSSFIKKQVQQAINSPSDEVGIKTKNLNIWCDSSVTWIPDDYVLNATQPVDRWAMAGQDCYCGVDLASNVDLTAVAYLWHDQDNDKYIFDLDYYIPHETLKHRLHYERDNYLKWVHGKFLQQTPGNVTDYGYILKDMLAVNRSSEINSVFYDQYNATAWATQCTEEGLNMLPFGQSIGNFNAPTREFERLVLAGKIVIADNPITRYCLRNTELRMDFNGNVKPLKNSERKKIDGVIAMLQALAAKMAADSDYKGVNVF